MMQRTAAKIIHARFSWKVIVAIVIVFIVFYIFTNDPNAVGYWRSTAGKQGYEKAYAEAMTALPPPTQTYDISTTYGTVRIYQWMNEETRSKTPAVFLPGRSSGVPMWSANLPAIALTRPVYAMDALGDAGLSQQTVPLKNGADQAAWVDQVLRVLELKSVHLIGHSFGGWAAANYASRYPERVTTLTLLEPVVTFAPFNWQVYIQTIPLSLPFLPKAWRESFLQDVGGATETDMNDPLARMIANGVESYAAKLPAPEQISNEQLKSWNMPVFVAMAGKSTLHDSTKAVAVANEHVKHVQAKLWPDASHSLPLEVASDLNKELINFLEANDQH
ncbi:MAG: alpha/beta hydrolase [Chloroflexaceae bacterium]|jgi:pimeloyl-ACP methyl ester carboxylesterase|nr:alpha/beta hydrolase [Chloroflexaceae bacterium]